MMVVAMTAALMLGTGVALGNTVPCPGGQDVAVLCTGKNPGEYASQGSDTINGSELKDLGRGQGDDDFVFGDGDADHGYGDAGDDRVSGGAGNDDMSGFEGEDGLQGGDGVDELDGGGCLNNLDGDAGDDRVFGGTQRDVLAGGLLDSVEGTEVVGEASDGDEAVRLAGELGPDVILMDLSMPNKNGVEATREILAGDPDTGILVVTMLEDDDSVFAAMRAGALGYLPKGARQEEVLRAIRAVANGEAIFGPGIAPRVMGLFSAPRPRFPQAFPDLTEREEEILALIAGGHDNAAIAARLFLSLKTVQSPVSNIFRKLGAADRVQAALRASEAGLGG